MRYYNVFPHPSKSTGSLWGDADCACWALSWVPTECPRLPEAKDFVALQLRAHLLAYHCTCQTDSPMRKENLLRIILIVAKEMHSLTPNSLIYWSNSQPFFRQWMHLSPPSPRAKAHRKSLEMLSPASGIKLYTEVQVQVGMGLRFRGWKIHLKEIYDHFKYSTARSSHGSKAVLLAASYHIN